MKLYINFPVQNKPWGGGAQFLNALNHELKERGCLADSPLEADCILVNSHHFLLEAARIKLSYPQIRLIHRLDGPISVGRKNGFITDKFIYFFNRYFSDGTIFQSEWSKNENIKRGLRFPDLNATIINAVTSSIFFSQEKGKGEHAPRIKIISATWSPAYTKGFDIYAYLDNHLDFSKYEYTFVGNTPISFKNIKILSPMNSVDLSRLLREQDIYITASLNDPCSNSLLEGLASGLACLARNSGGHPTILTSNRGVLFNGEQDIIERIDYLSNNLSKFQFKENPISMKDTCNAYLGFFQHSLNNSNKTPLFFSYCTLMLLHFINELVNVGCLKRFFDKFF